MRSHAKGPLVSIRIHVRARAAWLRTHACTRATQQLRKYRQVMQGARPILILFIALLSAVAFPHVFPFSRLRQNECFARPASHSANETRERVEGSRGERSRPRLAISRPPFISSCEGGIFGFLKKKHSSDSRCFPHKNARMACFRNDDVSNSALCIPYRCNFTFTASVSVRTPLLSLLPPLPVHCLSFIFYVTELRSPS